MDDLAHGQTVLTADGDGALAAAVTHDGATVYVVNVDGHDRCYNRIGVYLPGRHSAPASGYCRTVLRADD